MIPRPLLYVLLAIGAIGLGRVYGCTRYYAGAQDAKAKAERAAAAELATSNRLWLEEMDVALGKARADSSAAVAAIERANVRAVQRRARPALPVTATPSDTAAELRATVASLEQDTTDLRAAGRDMMRSLALLLSHGDTAKARVGETTADLELALERERMLHRFRLGLGLSLPKPPKWAAAGVGCAGGAAASTLVPTDDKRRILARLTGCATGAALATILTPTD